MIIGVIPARSGSKSIPDKNIKIFGGKPLMGWSIELAKKSGLFDKVLVTTDSEQYADIAKAHGAEVILRPVELAGDDTPMVPVLQHAIAEVEKSGQRVDIIVLLDPTSPLRKLEDIKNCLEKLNLPETDSVVTVCEVEHNPYFVMAKVENNYLKYPLFIQGGDITRRQDAPTVYRVNACVYAIKKETIAAGNIFTSKTRAVVMPQERSAHIDTLLDWKFGEFLLKEANDQGI